MSDEQLRELVERLEKGEWENSWRQGPNSTGFAVDATDDARAAASAIRQLMRERDEALVRVESLEDAWRYDRHRD